MTPEQRRRQLIHRVYGNLAIENPNITIELVTRLVDERLKLQASQNTTDAPRPCTPEATETTDATTP